jgi:hypothetical protein
MNSDNTATLAGNRFASESFNRNSLSGASGSIQVKYARLQGYLEGYLDQMSASKDAQEELISKLLSEIADMLRPITSSTEDR